MRRIAAFALAALLSLSLAASALADTINESLTISSAMSMTGVPASINYGNVTPGTPSAPQNFTVTVNSNVAWRVDLSGTDFTGPGTLTKAARQLLVDGLVLAGTNVGSYTGFDDPNLTGGGTAELFGNAAVNAQGTVHLRINAGFGATAGAYTGTVTVVLAAS